MPVNQQDLPTIKPYNPSEEEKDLVLRLNDRIRDLKNYRSAIKANPYDVTSSGNSERNFTNSRSIEQLWDFCDYVSLPHKYTSVDMEDWMCNNSRPLIYAKIETALAIMIEKNPEVEISARRKQFDKKTKILEALYALSWDKGRGRQQLIKLIYNATKYGFSVGREYHRYEEATLPEITQYDPVEFKHKTEYNTVIVHDEPYFEVLPIRDVWFDHRARPYDEDSIRDWYWEVNYDYSTFLKKFPKEKYPNAQYVQPSSEKGDSPQDKAELRDNTSGYAVRLGFYENKEDGEFFITDGLVLVYKGQLLNNELSCVPVMWRIRNDFTIYGVGVAEILENDQELLDKIANMTVNQVILAISGAGFYDGAGNVKESDMRLEPKLKKLRGAEKIQWPKIPMPDANVYKALDDIRNEADEMSGVTKSLGGEQVGKTLGEAVLNREAGLRRLAIPLNNIEFGLERHARLRIKNIQMIYSRPVKTTVIRDTAGKILDPELFEAYAEEKAQLGGNNSSHIQKFPEDPETKALFRNEYREERLPFEKTNQGEIEPSSQDQWLEIIPNEIKGEFDVKIKALSMIPMSKALQESKALETFNIIAKLPDTDINKAEKQVLKARGEDPEDWMQSDEDIARKQQEAMMAGQMGGEGGPIPDMFGRDLGGNAIPMEGLQPMMPPSQLEQPASQGGLSAQVSNALQ